MTSTNNQPTLPMPVVGLVDGWGANRQLMEAYPAEIDRSVLMAEAGITALSLFAEHLPDVR